MIFRFMFGIISWIVMLFIEMKSIDNLSIIICEVFDF